MVFRSLWLLILKETQTIVTGLTALSILRLRNAHSIYIGGGATLAAVVAKILKRFIRQPRPELSLKKTYGMPSTHSSSIAFFGVYLSLCIWNIRPHPRFLPHLLSRHGDSGDFSPLIRLLLTSGVAFGAISVCWSRVKLTYHTPAQVFAGASVGSILAVVCYAVWQNKLSIYADTWDAVIENIFQGGVNSLRQGSITPLRENVIAVYEQWRQHQRSARHVREL
ncbi:PAP2-domain-containing protein [Cystobasidium minutum MCA 4210]|uniref:PAP2-domain-containing protein n=1 Tax=Cystobasidium minutum MCA 4210 TaxID=1397322 RepID=UPI0034CEE0D3|eukprot:jgi/Rhomi1/159256/estExt_Genewise1Plus.C_3_t10481